jgi:hypothetical protein
MSIVGIGTTNPTETLDVNGNVRMRTGSSSGYIAVSDSDGVMNWTDPMTINTLQGIQGLAGVDGTDGTNGVDGNDGVDGTNGTNGVDGQDGLDGTNGTDGNNGVDGMNISGSSSQTLLHNGTNWVSTSNLSNDGVTVTTSSDMSINGNADISGELTVTGGVVNVTSSDAANPNPHTIGFDNSVGSLPGYANSYYPVIKTTHQVLYFVVNGNYAAYLTGGGITVNLSSKAKKENYEVLDKQDVLSRLNKLTIERWNYICEEDDIKRVGPYSEEFHKQFGLGGSDDKMIATYDMAGVSIVAIQALTERLEFQEEAIKQQQRKIDKLMEILNAK